MTVRPDPLTPPDYDLTSFPFMPLEVGRLRQSSIVRKTTGDEFRCAILLWCASWHQIPAASLPNDDQDLADYAGFGFAVKEWLKVKQGAMRGWILCSDNRWYHPVVAEKARESWRAKMRSLWQKEGNRIKQHNKRHPGNQVTLPDFDTWFDQGCHLNQEVPVTVTQPSCHGDTAGNSGDTGSKTGECHGDRPPLSPVFSSQQNRTEQNRSIKNKRTSSGGDSRSSSAVDNSPPPPQSKAESPNRLAEVAAILLEQRVVPHSAHNPKVAQIAAAGYVDAEIVAAIDVARARRADGESPQPVNPGLLLAILPEVRTRAAEEKGWWESWSGICAKAAQLAVDQHDFEGDAAFKVAVLHAAGDGPWRRAA